MKKSLLSIALFVFALSSLSAQTKFGVKSGYYDIRLKGEAYIDEQTISSSNLEYNSGFYVGLLAEFALSERFFIQPEINYARNLDARDFSFMNSSKQSLDQLNLPVLAKYKIGKKFKVFAGPNMTFLLNNTSNNWWELKTFSLSVNYGASFDITKKLSIELRFNNGFQNIVKPKTQNPYFSGKLRGCQIGLSYSF